MTRQQHADAVLQAWQKMRALPEDDRIELLMSRFFDPPIESSIEYESTLRRVSEAMSWAP